MTFDPTRPTGPQPQPFSPAPPEPANPTTAERLVGADRSRAGIPADARDAARRTRRQAEGIRRPVAQPRPRRGRRRRHRRRRVRGRPDAPPRSRRRPAGTAAVGAFANGSFAPRASGQPGFGGRGGFGGGAGAGLSINGTVKSVDGNTLTITTANGQTIEVTTGDSTTYHTPGARDRGRRQDGLERAGPAPVRRQRRRRPPERELGTGRPDRHRRQRHRRPVIEGVR